MMRMVRKAGQSCSQGEEGKTFPKLRMDWCGEMGTSDCADDNTDNEHDVDEVDEDDEKDDDIGILMQSHC